MKRQSRQIMKQHRFKSVRTEEAARAVLAEIVPRGTVVAIARSRLEALGFTCHMVDDRTMACRRVERSLTMVHAVWSLALRFDESAALDELEVHRGLAGP